jgi:hypothetical protein
VLLCWHCTKCGVQIVWQWYFSLSPKFDFYRFVLSQHFSTLLLLKKHYSAIIQYFSRLVATVLCWQREGDIKKEGGPLFCLINTHLVEYKKDANWPQYVSLLGPLLSSAEIFWAKFTNQNVFHWSKYVWGSCLQPILPSQDVPKIKLGHIFTHHTILL